MLPTIKSANASLVWLSIRWLLSSPLDDANVILHIVQLLNSFTLDDVINSVCSHLGCIEYIV